MRRSTMGCIAAAMVLLCAGAAASAQAPARKAPVLIRMFTGPDGLTHVEEGPLPKGLIPAENLTFERTEPNAPMSPKLQGWHNAPYPRYVITLSGGTELEISGSAQHVVSDADHVLLAEDVTGKGHRFVNRTIGGVPVIVAYVRAPSDKPRP